ncbi:capsid assembly scaffolding protein Gp46 family protein [Fusobacterium perfoetens]|uniref:capsid assembly scaffolding protein Gp46 family protein n=1 Tax=Fusobacterium perfoetens TaxID=852 RepID=UPI001F424F1E|nr:DUF4355 domain-containing protein [Fusobacterium perfoetens]MCF2612857.1 DUF4355 domain-containing protein [Fusobacterium perfoetens]
MKQNNFFKTRGFNIQIFAEGDKTFTQEELDKAINDRLARERKKFDAEKKELERKHNESIEDYEERIKTANMTAEEKFKLEIEKRDKLLAEKEGALKKIEVDGIKKAFLSKYKLPEKFMSRISGETEEDIEASVKEFNEVMGEYIKSQAGGTPDNLNGGSGEKTKTDKGLEAFDKAYSSY